MLKSPKISTVFIVISLILLITNCKNTEKVLEKINKNSIASNKSYQVLEYLCKQSPGRLPGTPQSAKAIEYIRQTMVDNGADSVWLFPVKAPGWSEIKKPVTEIILGDEKRIVLNSVSLGQCVPTTDNGIENQIVTINNKDQIDSLGENGLKGKIVFFNLKMQTRNDYGKMVWQRVLGASMVAKYGAVGVLERSLTTKKDDNPHTGVVRYDEQYPKIPAVALSWQAADNLEKQLTQNPDLKVHMETYCNNPGLVPSNNIVAEIKGSKYPDEIYLLTAHLDAWHNAEGAQDDGGGVSQIVDVIRIFKELKIKPKHTIRVMAYNDEEQYNNGMKQYAEQNAKNISNHIYEIEVDNGIGEPTGINIQADSAVFTKQQIWRKYLDKYQLHNIKFANAYAKEWPLYETDSIIMSRSSWNDPHYFDYHHSANDVFETVDKLNLQKGSAALAGFIYVLDKLDVIDNTKRNKK